MDTKSNISGRDFLGYAFVLTGVIIIALAFQNGFQLFRGDTKPIEIFNLPGISVDLTKSLAASLPTGGATPPSNPEEFISGEAVNAPLNFFAHVALLGFFASIGGKVAGIGVDLTRPYIIRPQASKVSQHLEQTP